MTTAVALQFQAANVSRDVTHVLARSGQGTAAQQARQVTLQRQNQDTPKSSQFRMFAVYKSKDDVLHCRDGVASQRKTRGTLKFAALRTSCVCHEQEQQEPWPMQQRNAEDMPELGVSKEYPWDHCLSEQCVASLKIHIAYHCHTF